MTPTEAVITLSISDKICNYLLTACYEGGSAYWLSCDSVVYTGHDTDDYGVSKILGCFDTEDEEMQWGDADWETMRKGIARLCLPESKVRSDIRQTVLGLLVDEENTDWDAETADCVLQFGLLGELVYA